MICSESCNVQSDGTLFRPGHPKNEALTLCVASYTESALVLNVLKR